MGHMRKNEDILDDVRPGYALKIVIFRNKNGYKDFLSIAAQNTGSGKSSTLSGEGRMREECECSK